MPKFWNFHLLPFQTEIQEGRSGQMKSLKLMRKISFASEESPFENSGVLCIRMKRLGGFADYGWHWLPAVLVLR
jgi:hypothetical protein